MRVRVSAAVRVRVKARVWNLTKESEAYENLSEIQSVVRLFIEGFKEDWCNMIGLLSGEPQAV